MTFDANSRPVPTVSNTSIAYSSDKDYAEGYGRVWVF